MRFDFLPEEITKPLNNIEMDKLYQIRLRANFPISIIFENNKYYLSEFGLSENNKKAIVCKHSFINYVIEKVTENSIYAFNDKIIKGFLTTQNGIRIGIAGECVFDNNKIITIKNISSLNIRIPHEIDCCAKKLLKTIINSNKINNTLIISPPFCGKTTLLKDVAKTLDKTINKSILIIDERGEFEKISGENIDKIKFCNKKFAFEYGVRSLAPDVIITDELSDKQDWLCAKSASSCGVKIIASCHAENIEQVFFKKHFIKNVFERYVILESGQFGIIKSIYDGERNKL